MREKLLGAVFAVVVVFSLAQVAGAQGRPPGGFGPGGPGGPGGMMGGRGCVATATAPCPAYQFTFTITSMEPVLVNGTPGTIPVTTTGTIAGDAYGSTYREVTSSGMGPWASQSKPNEFIFIKNLDPGVMMSYSVNVTKSSYEQFAIKQHTPKTPPANWQGKGPNGGNSSNRPAPSVGPDSSSGYPCQDAQTTTFTHTVQLPGVSTPTTITSHRVYCPDLRLVIEEDHSDPRFGTRKYQLGGYTTPPTVSFTPPFGLTPAPALVQKKNMGHHHGPMGGSTQPAA